MAPLEAELALALELAELAADIALARFGAADLEVEGKPDGSPVSDADRAAEAAIRQRLAVARLDHAVLGEEFGPTGDGPYRWVLDPIDGTSHFVVGDPTWQVLVSLLHEDEVIVGVALAPALERRYWAARGLGAFRDGTRLRVSDTATMAEAVVHDDWTGAATARDAGHPITRLAGAAGRVVVEPGDGLLAVADGRADLCLNVGGEVWDFAAASILVEEAGGRFTDFDGRRSLYSRNALVSNGRLHDAALAAVGARP